ncbi:MAG: hypothetical protein ACR2GP_15260 [Burkholderiaceae bacterium]
MAVNPVHETDSTIEAALQSLIDLYGPALLFESGRLERSLQDQFPDAQREITVLVHALDKQVPQDLLGVHADEDLQRLLPLLAQRLSRHKDLTLEAANWGVRTWARGLGLAVYTTGPLPESVYRDGVLASAAGVDNGGQAAVDVDNDESDPQESGQLVTSLAAPTSGPLRSRAFNLWVTVVATLVAVVAIWFASFYEALEITQVTSGEPLIGDGTKRDVLMSFKARRVDVDSVQVRLVRGEGPPDRQPSIIKVSPEAAAAGLTGAGQIGLRTTTPTTATFEYVLVSADGKRSAPFQKTFEIAAGPPQPPVITGIDVPRDIVAGQPFELTIAYGQGSGSVAKVERKVIDSTTAWRPQVATTATSELAGSKAGAVTYPFEAIAMPSQSTIAFTLVGSDGARSEPRRIEIDVAPPRIAATAPRPARVASDGCTSSTCGRVVSIREVDSKAKEPDLGTKVTGFFGRLFGHADDRTPKRYRITVRMDDGSTRVVIKPAPWQSGARVRVVGRTLVAVKS